MRKLVALLLLLASFGGTVHADDTPISGPAEATKTAVRVGVVEVPDQFDELGFNPDGLRGMPFAPDNLTECDEMNWWRVQAGLPIQFGDQPRSGTRRSWGFGWRESNCRNDLTNSVGRTCCHGYWQMHQSNISASGYGPYVREHCEIARVSDYKGLSPLQKQKSACFAWVVFSMSGFGPWNNHL